MESSIEFRDLLLEYHFILMSSKRRAEHVNEDESVLLNRLYVNREWFHYMRRHLFNDEDIFEIITDKRRLGNKRFLLDEKHRCPGCEDGKPFKIIKYRGIDIPVYDDDYGQQDFAVIDGKIVSGGSYNFFADDEFIGYVDIMLEDKYLKNEYDMYAEIKALYPEWKDK